MALELTRIDIHATHRYEGYKLRPGRPLPYGASRIPGGINFSVVSRHATGCTLVLFHKREPLPFAEIPFFEEFRVGDVFAMVVFDLDFENLEYGFRFKGPHTPEQGHRFDPSRILLDPYAKAIGGRDVWGAPNNPEDVYPYRARIVYEDFDWEDDRLLQIPFSDLVIYEMHVRGFTAHPSSGVKHPGTFAAIREKIPYLKALGVNAVELMPIFEFDELDNPNINPETGASLKNYWGYNTVGFFAPKAGYAATGRFTMQTDELKNLVKTLHQNGIEVILDVVFNHTAEGGEDGPTFSYRGIDNKTYYMLTPKGEYQNFSGTGNTLNCNNPVVRHHVIDALRYWVSEYHIDGFRFDLASILGRDPDGEPLENPPLLEALAHDPILARCKLIAEAWDAGGLYQVGNFPAYGRWAEWNGQFRDTLRRFLRAERGWAHEAHLRIAGSPDLYPRGPHASINFITAHDGFTLRDLFSYDRKHNESNGEQSRDGSDENFSWNCGVEGHTEDPAVNALRRRLMKNAVALLFLSQGVPMLLMGDERGHTRDGNNNPYCHDSALTWIDWSPSEIRGDMFRFTQRMIEFRKAHPILRSREHLKSSAPKETRFPSISWHGIRAWHPDHSEHSRTLAFLLAPDSDDLIYVAWNSHWETHRFFPPRPGNCRVWHRFANTGLEPPLDISEVGQEPALQTSSIELAPRSLAILVARQPA